MIYRIMSNSKNKILKAVIVLGIIMLFSSVIFVKAGNTQAFFPAPPFFNPFYCYGYSPLLAPLPLMASPIYSTPFRTAALLLTATPIGGGIATPTPGTGGLLSLLPTLTAPPVPTTVAPLVPAAPVVPTITPFVTAVATVPPVTVLPTVAPSVTLTLNIPSLTLTIPGTALAGLIPAPAPVVPAAPVVTTTTTPTLGLTGLTALMGGLSTTTLLALGI